MMTKPEQSLRDLLECLGLERREPDLFRGHGQPTHNGRIFGGLVFAQAMRAGQTTVDGRDVHSAHAYFLRPGDPELPIEYEVDRIRDGRSFATRRVVARQDGQAIFNLSMSFHKWEPGASRQIDTEISGEPEGEPYEDGIRRTLKASGVSLSAEQFGFGPIEILVEGGLSMDADPPRPPELQAWFRSRGPLPDEPGLHAAILAYASDQTIVVSALHPMEFGLMSSGVQSASVDHAIWFHEPFRMDDWILAVHDSPVLKNSRALGRALFYTRDGRLVASAIQEGLVRRHT
ncbi:MAG: acyl-CoA thioesterase II [Deltaproteobacteria bacterium]|nr:acyl-CoA thioesterase II [Deltaproteobacteria bacterium]